MNEQELVIDVDPARVMDLLHGLTEDLVAKGAVRSPQWRAVFERTPRHLFVPRFYRRIPSGRQLVDGSQPEQRKAWLAGVYADDALTIQYDLDHPIRRWRPARRDQLFNAADPYGAYARSPQDR